MKIKTITQMFVLLLNISFSLLATETYIASDLGYIKMDTTFNIPRVITCMQNGEYTGTVEDIASQYITENSMFLFKDASAKFEKIKIVNNPSGTHIGFQQVINNVPVIGSDIAISLNKKNEISMVTNNYKPSITIQTIPSISLGVAIQIARNSFDNPDFETMIPIKSQLSVYVNESYISFLVWKLNILSNEDDSDWYILINALDGSIVKKEDIAKSNHGRVFNPDPGTYLENIELLDNRDLDYPELSNAYKTVALEGLNPPVNGLYRLRGEYAYSIDIGLPNDPVTEEPTTEFNYNRSQNGFEEVNCYSHLDNEIRYVRELGFNPLWDNISVGYKDILFDARGTRTRNAAYFCTNDHIRFGVPVDNVDAGEDQSVIVHELGHALHDALIIDDISSGGPDLRGISEGISDYFGIDYRRQIERELGLPYFFPNARTNWFWPVTNLGPTIRSEYEANFSTWDLPGFIDEEYLYTDPYIRMRTWASSLMDLEYVSATEPSQGYRLGRDIVTTLQLASLSYITSYNDRYDNVLAMYQADIDIYDGMHLKDLIEVYSNRLLFYDQVISNNVVTNTTWDGYKLVNSDISVENGATLTIAPNTYFILYGNLAISTNSKIIIDPSVRIIAGPGAKITIQNGVTLNLNGVTIKGDDWAGIVAEPGSTINVLNSHFKGAQMAISGTPMICNISNSIFENCINGVSFIASKGLKIIGNSFSGLAEGSAVTVIQSSGNISQNNIVNYSK
ncbi:MAG: hypothetical protein L6407_09650, partial [Candidatus Delongbacteria bacterium]|nr:hypothetical protein [Candidatus Delongbacteria bacterium]